MSDQEQAASTPLAEQNGAPEPAGGQTPARKGPVQWFARLTLTQLTLGVVVALFLWQWLDAHYQLDRTELEVARRLAEVEASNKAGQILVAQNQELVRELGGKLSLLESRYAETQNQRAALESLYRDMSSNRDLLALAEVEQMLLIAVQQLQLSANIKAALIAMQQAETRLQHLNRPAFAGLRKRITQDIDRLRALPNIDTPAVNQRLNDIIAAVDSLPLAQDAPLQPQQPAAEEVAEKGVWMRFWHELWQETKTLIRIENTGQPELPLLSPTQAFFLRENLKLRLFSARMAMLTRDEVSFRRDLKTAQDWLKRYFDTQAESTVKTSAALQKLAASSVAIEMPDISGTLEAVRNYRVSHEREMR